MTNPHCNNHFYSLRDCLHLYYYDFRKLDQLSTSFSFKIGVPMLMHQTRFRTVSSLVPSLPFSRYIYSSPAFLSVYYYPRFCVAVLRHGILKLVRNCRSGTLRSVFMLKFLMFCDSFLGFSISSLVMMMSVIMEHIIFFSMKWRDLEPLFS